MTGNRRSQRNDRPTIDLSHASEPPPEAVLPRDAPDTGQVLHDEGEDASAQPTAIDVAASRGVVAPGADGAAEPPRPD